MANASQFIGCKISLISKSEIRYEGILYSLDVVEATISLAKVKSFGTEDRHTDRMVPPKDEIYEFIIFRGSDIKGIDVVEPPKPAPPILNDGLANDPAIVEVSHYHTSSRSHSTSNIGPVPVQVQVPSSYATSSGASYGSSPFGGAGTSGASSVMPKPVSTPQVHPPPPAQRSVGSISSPFVAESPETSTSRVVAIDEVKTKETSGGPPTSTPALKTSNAIQDESQSRLPYGRGQGYHRGGSDDRPRGGRGAHRGEGQGGRGGRRHGPQDYSERQEHEGGYGSGGRGRSHGSGDQTHTEGQGYHRSGGEERPRGGRGDERPRGSRGSQPHRGEGQGGHVRRQGSQDYTEVQEGGYGSGGRGRSHGSGDHIVQEGQGYSPRGRGGSGHYNAGNGFRGGRGGGGGGYRNNRTQGMLRAPQSAKVTFDNDFDFEKANEELQTAIKNLKITEKANEVEQNGGISDQVLHMRNDAEEQENKEPPAVCYKKDDFFDSISCEALERGKGASNRPDWKAERKLNAETFGLSGRGGGGRGYYHRGGGRGYYHNQGGGGYGGGGYRGGFGGYRGGGGGGSGYSSYNNRYNGGVRRGRGGASDGHMESTRGFGSF